MISFILVCIIFEVIHSHSNWAVIIAGSNGYYNYRHQSDISHTYQILVKEGGFPPENVITFMYNDIAYNVENPYQGQIFNEPNGINYYDNINISYQGYNVTTDIFLSVLKGIEIIPGKPVLKSGPEDNVFIYYSDHGATGLVAMPTGPELYADQLMSTLEYMYNHSMYNQLLFYLEACESGSMFDGILPHNISIYATTAATPDESSYAYYYNDSLQTYMADEYSIRWMQDTEDHENTFESLIKQFVDVRKMVNQSTPQQYGDFKLVNDSIWDFQTYEDDHKDYEDYKYSDDKVESIFETFYDNSLLIENDKTILSVDQYYKIANYIRKQDSCSSRNVPLCILYQKLLYSNNEMEIIDQINDELKQRAKVDIFFRDLVGNVLKMDDFLTKQKFISMYTPPRNFECLRSAVSMYKTECHLFDDYSWKYVRTLVNLCERYPEEEILYALSNQCK